jgi:hypothetical protein
MWSGPPTAAAPACEMRPCLEALPCLVPIIIRKRKLECLRLASDLTQLAADTLNPHLKAHCVRMAKVWSGEAEKKPAEFKQMPDAQRTVYH